MGGDFCCFARLPSHSGVDIISSSALGARRSVGGSAEPAVGNATSIAAKAPVWIGAAVTAPVERTQTVHQRLPSDHLGSVPIKKSPGVGHRRLSLATSIRTGRIRRARGVSWVRVAPAVDGNIG